MSLITSERQAVEVLANRIKREGATGTINFARTVLGAHSEQAKRLAGWAEEVAVGMDPDAYEYLDAQPEIQVTRTVEDKDLTLTLKTDLLPITSYEELVDFYEIDTEVWKPTRQTFNFWGNDKAPNFQVKAHFQRDDYAHVNQLDREATREFFASLAPAPVKSIGFTKNDNILFEIMVADLHAGRSGETVQETVDRLRNGVLDLLNWTYSYSTGRIAIVFNGDTFNDDNGSRTTTKGTPVESDGDWRKVFVAVRNAIAELALTAAEIAPVDLYIIEGNHDRERSFYLADSLYGLMVNQDRVIVHTDTLRNYIDWGITTIGLAHGDEMKPLDMAMAMFRETNPTGKQIFEWHLGHKHTRTEDEVSGVLFRRFRTPNPISDDYHLRKGFNHNTRDIVGIVWDKERGEISTHRVITEAV